MAGIGLNPSQCCCASSACSVTFNVKGCFSLPLTSAYGSTTISVWTNSLKTVFVASGVTDASGSLTLSGLTPYRAPPLLYYFEAVHSSGRFSVASGFFTCGLTVSVTMGGAPHPDYVCAVNCALPINRTLYYNDSVVGDVTLTYSSGVWSGDAGTISYGGCTDGIYTCSPATVPVTFRWDVGIGDRSGYAARVTDVDPFPTDYLCPVASGGSVWAGSTVSVSISCPPAFLVTLTTRGGWECATDVAGTITE